MAASDRRGQEEDGIKRFDPRILDRSVIAIPLLEEINKDENEVDAVIIDVNLDYDEGREAGRTWIREAIKNAIGVIAPSDEEQGVRKKKTELSNQYVFARLRGKRSRELVRLDVEHAEPAHQRSDPRHIHAAARAVGIAYPVASRLAGTVASAFGDANDKFGGLGRNGAQKMERGEVG